MSFNYKLRTAVIGATGFTGLDLVYLLSKHPKVNIINLCATKNLGKKIHHFDKRLKKNLPKLTSIEKIDWDVCVYFRRRNNIGSIHIDSKVFVPAINIIMGGETKIEFWHMNDTFRKTINSNIETSIFIFCKIFPNISFKIFFRNKFC